MPLITRDTAIKTIATGTVITLFGIIIISADQIISWRLKKSIPSDAGSLPEGLQKAALQESKGSHGSLLQEGALTSQIIQQHRHHDAQDLINRNSKNPDQHIWIFGDSWGEGIKQEEKKNHTISEALNTTHELRIIGVSSHSPLLMNLAYRNRLQQTGQHPDTIVIHLDQTDIGDDYCRYRPYVLRTKAGELAGVSKNSQLELRGGSTLNLYYKTLAPWKSGLLYLAKTRLNNFLSNSMGIAGITDCQFNDLMAYQQGRHLAPSGARTSEYEAYFANNITAFSDEILSNSPNTKIIFVSHDWAQHSLPKNHDEHLPKNIKKILSRLAETKNNLRHLHITASTHYPGKTIGEIYKYPNDRFSHLKSYAVLSKAIAEEINYAK